MKKILTYISSAVAVFLSVSCTERVALFDAGYVLSFEAQTTEMETRADYVTGETKYHENEITTMDWFFFSDEQGTNLLYHVTTSGDDAHKLNLTTDIVEAKGLRGKSYLYAVANGPTGVASKTTLADIKAMPVSTEFTKTETDDEGSEALKLDVANLKFIMDTYDNETKKYLKEISPKQVADGVTDSVQETIKVQLSRLAVKFSTKVKIAKSVTTTDTFGNTETWTPILTQTDFDAYMMNALKAGTMSGDPVRRADEGVDQDNYFSYGRNLATVEKLADEGDYYVWQTVDPFYTYPQKWNDTDNNEPYIKIIFPWMSDVKGSAEFHYKVVLPAPEDHVFTLERNCWYKLTATIAVLGGTENDYVLIDDVEVSVANWADPGWLSGAGVNSARFFNVPGTKNANGIIEFDVYSLESFDIPVNTNGTAKVYIQKVQFNDYSGASTSTVSKTFNKPNPFTTTNTVAASNFNGYTEYDYKVTFNGDDKYNKKVVFEHKLTDIYIVRDVTIYIEKDDDSNKNQTVIIHHHPAIELKKKDAGDMFVNGYFARVSNAVDINGNSFGSSWTDNGVTYRHTYSNNSNYWYNSNTLSYITNGGTHGYGSVMGRQGGSSTTVSSNYFTTDITVTAFSSNNNHYTIAGEGDVNYKIGDPRVKASSVYSNFSLNEYLSGPNTTTRGWTNAGDIMICSQEVIDRNLIAPHFLVSSGLTELVVGNIPSDFIDFVKRGATFQEAGYPAGRWRLPTEAEVAFIAARQFDGSLPDLFNRDVPYYCASGRWVIIPSSGTTLTFGTNINQRITVWGNTYTISQLLDAKFIYDLWYWGDTPEATNVYHPNGHTYYSN